MDFLLSKYGLIFTEFDSIDQGRAAVNTFKFCKYQTIFLLSKISITVLLYTVKSFTFVGLKFRGFVFKNVFVDIYFRCFLICSQK